MIEVGLYMVPKIHPILLLFYHIFFLGLHRYRNVLIFQQEIVMTVGIVKKIKIVIVIVIVTIIYINIFIKIEKLLDEYHKLLINKLYKEN